MSAAAVFLIAAGTAFATGLGVLPVLAAHLDEKRSIAITSAIAGGFMLGASVALFYEGGRESIIRTLIGAAVGAGFILVTSRYLGRGPEVGIGELRGARGMTAVLVIGVMTIHSFSEGVAIGVSLAGERSLGILIAVAIAIHNIPEGVAVSLTLVPFGESGWRAAAWSVFSSLPQPLMAVPAFLAVRTFEPLLAGGLGFAGGAMVWMVTTQLLPEAFTAGSRGIAFTMVAASTAAMIVIELLIGL